MAVLPFSLSVILAIFGYEAANWITVVGFIGFTAWFLVMSWAFTGKKNVACQRIVSEEELAAHLAQGYIVVAVLESGKVVVAW